MKVRLLFTFLTLLTVLSPGTAGGAGEDESIRLTVLFTNDVHGYIEPCG